jgi:uncharacterized protein (UPF0332 family)
MSLDTTDEYLDAAQSHLGAARFCFEHGRNGLAGSEAYFSMIASVNALLLARDRSSRDSHSGVLNAVYLVFVDELGLLEKNAHSVMTDAKNWRRKWHYEGRVPPAAPTEQFVSLAERCWALAAEA